MRSSWGVANTVLGAALVMLGCVAPDDGPAGPDGHDQLAPPVQGMETQGKHLLGEGVDGRAGDPGFHFSVTTAAIDRDGHARTVEFSGSASLALGTRVGVDSLFSDLIITAAGPGEVRISPVRGGTDVAFYKLDGRVSAAGPWVDLCAGGDAVPLAGVWDLNGRHHVDPSRISFACAGSVAYKCTVWGYLAGSDDRTLAWRSHQACTRMARGDYCADGTTHTREGTRIKIYDHVGVSEPPTSPFLGVQSWPPAPGRFFFEAAWGDGDQPARCLSRLRWQSLPLGGLCEGDTLRDPRRNTGGKFCEDLVWPDASTEPTGGLVFNESRYSDLGLLLWQNGNDRVTTVRGFFEGVGLSGFEPFPLAGPYTHVLDDALAVRSIPEGADLADFEELRLYHRPGDFVVAGVSQPPAGFTDMGFEGYVRTAPQIRGVPLRLYQHTITNDLVSTARAAPANYVLLTTIGYVIPSEQ